MSVFEDLKKVVEDFTKDINEEYNPLIINEVLNLEIGAIVINELGRIVDVSPYLCNVLNYKSYELKGKDFILLIHPDDIERTIKAFEQVKDGGRLNNFVNRYIGKDGTSHKLLWRRSISRESKKITIGICERYEHED